MMTGEKTFICDDCKHKFVSFAMEYQGTSINVPVKCPKCGSLHTYVPGLLGGLIGPSAIYKTIWADRDNFTTNDNTMTMTPYFVPYIGSGYNTGSLFPKRILILGDSHYCGDCERCGIKGKCDINGFGCRNFTRDVVAKFLEYRQGKRPHEGWMNTYLKFEKALVGHETDSSESLQIWNSVAFYNYIQTAYIGESRQAYSDSDYMQSFPFFMQVLYDLKPDMIIVWGYRLWDRLPGENWTGGGKVTVAGIEEDYGYYTLANGKKVLAVRSAHPSAGFAWDSYGEVFKTMFTF